MEHNYPEEHDYNAPENKRPTLSAREAARIAREGGDAVHAGEKFRGMFEA